MNVNGIREILIDRGRQILSEQVSCIKFTGGTAADVLVNDLQGHPHAFVVGCIMDRQVKSEQAWSIPYLISEKLGDFCFSTLKGLALTQVNELMSQPKPLHRFPVEMSRNLHAAIALIGERYEGNAAGIWLGKPPSAEVVYRFLEFRGMGPKIATMAANILVRHFKIPLSDYYSVDVSPDTHLRRVFARLGLSREDASPEELIYRARALHPEFPGLMDFPAWDIGKSWCKAGKPLCGQCYMKELCPTAGKGVST